MKIVKFNKIKQNQIINQTAEALDRGKLVIYPTETVYGVAVDATNPQAVSKLLKYKSKQRGKPISIAVVDQNMAQKYVQLNNQAKKIYQNLLPGPYTVISQSNHQTDPRLESEFHTLGIRIPDHKLILDIIKKLNKPITATSANQSRHKTPYQISDILDTISNSKKQLIDLIIDAGTLPKNDPSTIIDTTLSTPLVLRGLKKAKQIIQSNSEQNTSSIAQRILLKHSHLIKEQCLIFALDGELGAGKTVFVKALANYLDIKEPITSPTYNYVHEYEYQKHQINGKFYHADMWKINSLQQYQALKMNTLIKPGNIIAIEWFDQIKKYFNKNNKYKKIYIQIQPLGEKQRKILIND